MGFAALTLPLQQSALALLERLAPASDLPPHLLTGLRGERAAHFYLRRLGYTVVAQRYTAAPLRGDIDIVAWDGPTLVFFEVKTLTAASAQDAYLPAEAAVDRGKKVQLRKLATAYLRHVPPLYRENVPIRFDVLSVYLPRKGDPAFEHFPNAFSMRETVEGYRGL
jgi:putative endonuclease